MIDESPPRIEPLAVRVAVIDFQMERGHSGRPAAGFQCVQQEISDALAAPPGPDIQLVDERVAPAVLQAETAAEDPVADRLLVDAREPGPSLEGLDPQLPSARRRTASSYGSRSPA